MSQGSVNNPYRIGLLLHWHCKANQLSAILSKFGTILKRETLTSTSPIKGVRNLVLHSNDPFPGYYCDEEAPADNSCKLISYYIPLEEELPSLDDHLCRASLELQKELGKPVCPAWFTFEERRIRALRIKEVVPNEVSDLIDHLKARKIKLHSSQKIRNFLSHIHMKSFFEVNEIHTDIYQNVESQGLYYFVIPGPLEWADFERVITYQKSNSRFKNFDAAIGFWMNKPMLVDFVRIYGNDLDMDQLIGIRDDFLKNIKTYKRQGMLI